MPNIQLQPLLPKYPHDWSNPNEVRTWAESIQSALQRIHATVTYIVNASVRNTTHALRTDTPDIDECFAYETDTNTLFVAADGVWEQVSCRQSRTAVGAGASTIAVTLSPAVASANYSVVATPDWLTTVRATSKTTSGFTIDFGTAAPGGGGTVTWMLMEDPA